MAASFKLTKSLSTCYSFHMYNLHTHTLEMNLLASLLLLFMYSLGNSCEGDELFSTQTTENPVGSSSEAIAVL